MARGSLRTRYFVTPAPLTLRRAAPGRSTSQHEACEKTEAGVPFARPPMCLRTDDSFARWLVSCWEPPAGSSDGGTESPLGWLSLILRSISSLRGIPSYHREWRQARRGEPDQSRTLRFRVEYLRILVLRLDTSRKSRIPRIPALRWLVKTLPIERKVASSGGEPSPPPPSGRGQRECLRRIMD